MLAQADSTVKFHYVNHSAIDRAAPSAYHEGPSRDISGARRSGLEQIDKGQRLLSAVLEQLKASASVQVVFGEEKKVGERTLIPIAAVAYCFCGGAGGGTGAPGEEEGAGGSGGGAGGGGGVRVKPLAVLEVSGEGTRVIPIVDVTRIATLGLGVLLLLALGRLLRRR